MLDQFVQDNREAIIALARTQVAHRSSSKPSEGELENGLSVFLDQLLVALRRAKVTDVIDHRDIEQSAGAHGQVLLRLGLTIGQVVHDYGSICQSITQLAIDRGAPISPENFRTLNLCLDNAIAEAVTQFSAERERTIADVGTTRQGTLADEMRNLLSRAMSASESVSNGQVAPNGSTARVLRRSLIGMSILNDRSLAEARVDAGIQLRDHLVVARLLGEIEVVASLQANAHSVGFVFTLVDPELTVWGDRIMVVAAVANLLNNAFRFTHERGTVTLTTRATDDSVLFEVGDECGGLAPGVAERLLAPDPQPNADGGVSLGLSISRKVAAAHNGAVLVRNLPGRGCVFTLSLPRAQTRETELH